MWRGWRWYSVLHNFLKHDFVFWCSVARYGCKETKVWLNLVFIEVALSPFFSLEQCDQMMKKVAKIFPILPKKAAKSCFIWEMYNFKKPKILQEYMGYFCKKICYQQVQNIALSGHTALEMWMNCKLSWCLLWLECLFKMSIIDSENSFSAFVYVLKWEYY